MIYDLFFDAKIKGISIYWLKYKTQGGKITEDRGAGKMVSYMPTQPLSITSHLYEAAG